MANEKSRQSMARLSFTMKPGVPEQVSRFFPLLRQGFIVRAWVGCSIRELLCTQFGVSPDYLLNRITTIFLNGKAIDDPESSRVAHGATLALSAAMPGLVGATMRRGGYYAAMRGAITHRDPAEGAEEKNGEVRLKLFNLLMAEMGPGFLRKGVIVASAALADFLAGQSPDFWAGCGEVLLNGKPLEPGFPKGGAGLAEGEESVELSVLFEE